MHSLVILLFLIPISHAQWKIFIWSGLDMGKRVVTASSNTAGSPIVISTKICPSPTAQSFNVSWKGSNMAVGIPITIQSILNQQLFIGIEGGDQAGAGARIILTQQD